MELSIELQVTMLLFFALLGYIMALRINQSAVVGVIIMDIIGAFIAGSTLAGSKFMFQFFNKVRGGSRSWDRNHQT